MKNNNTQQPQMQTITYAEVKEKMDQYNEQVINIDEKYKKLVPVNGNILVRVYKTMFNARVNVETQQAGGKSKMVDMLNPLPYSLKAVVVASEQSEYKSGDTVIMSPQAIATNGQYPDFIPNHIFFLEDFTDEGYLLIPSHYIRCKLND